MAPQRALQGRIYLKPCLLLKTDKLENLEQLEHLEYLDSLEDLEHLEDLEQLENTTTVALFKRYFRWL